MSFHIQLKERDWLILEEVFRSPAATRHPLAIRFFNGSYEAAKKRVQQLLKAGLLRSDAGGGREILRVTKLGISVLRSKLDLDPLVSAKAQNRVHPRMAQHEQMLADCRATILRAVESREDLQLEEFATNDPKTWFTVDCPVHRMKETVKPDGYLQIKQLSPIEKTHRFFIEIDRSTETQSHLVHLARQYQAYQKSGDFAARCGFPLDAKACPFRVLLVMKSKERIKETAEQLRIHTQIRSLILMTAIEELLRDPLGRVCPVRPNSLPYRSRENGQDEHAPASKMPA